MVGLFLLVLVVLLVYWQQDAIRGAVSLDTTSTIEAPITPPPPAAIELGGAALTHFGAGQAASARGAHLEAARSFYSVLQEEPRAEAAERLGYRACEQAVLTSMRGALLGRSLTDSQKRALRRDALASGRQAAKTGEDVVAAAADLDEALVLYPGDRSLERVRADVQVKLDEAAAVAAAEARKASIERLYRLARLEHEQFETGDATRASVAAAYEAVVLADPERTSHLSYDAADRARSFREQLGAEALEQGAALEADGDIEGAVERYREAVEQVQDPLHATHKRAQERLDALAG